MLFAALAGILPSTAYSKIVERIRPNPYAPPLPDQQAHAAAGALREGTSGMAGSEADYYTDDQGIGSIGFLHIAQDLSSRQLPPSWFLVGDPGAGPEPTVLADFDRRPVDGGPRGAAWGASTRTIHNGAQNVQAATLLSPTYVSPTAKGMVAEREKQAAPDALAGLWGD